MDKQSAKTYYYQLFFQDLRDAVLQFANFNYESGNDSLPFLNYKLLKRKMKEFNEEFFELLKTGLELLITSKRKKKNKIKFRHRFCLLFHFLAFWMSQKKNAEVADLCLILKWKHLSNSGFDILNQIGLLPSLPTVNKLIKNLAIRTKNSTLTEINKNFGIFWADNFVRNILLKKFRNDRYLLNYTVFSLSHCHRNKGPNRSKRSRVLPLRNERRIFRSENKSAC